MAKQPHSIYERLLAVEDRLEIYNLIASHPPSADTGADYYSRAIYVEEGELDGIGEGVVVGELCAQVGLEALKDREEFRIDGLLSDF